MPKKGQWHKFDCQNYRNKDYVDKKVLGSDDITFADMKLLAEKGGFNVIKGW